MYITPALVVGCCTGGFVIHLVWAYSTTYVGEVHVDGVVMPEAIAHLWHRPAELSRLVLLHIHTVVVLLSQQQH